MTRDRELLAEVLKALFCFVFEDLGSHKNSRNLLKEYNRAFQRVKDRVGDVFDAEESILLDAESLDFVHQIFQSVDLHNDHVDPAADLYQTFMGSEARGAEGQFFTPIPAVSWLVDAVAPKAGESIIDPACGVGTFLSYAARKAKAAAHEPCLKVFGIEKDRYLSKLARAHVALYQGASPNVYCGDSLAGTIENGDSLPFSLDGAFDIVLANPPFGAKIKAGSQGVISNFELGHKWKRDKKSNCYQRTDFPATRTPPQILFVERCIGLLKAGGRLGIVVPESMLTSSSTQHVCQFILDRLKLTAVIGMPESLFKTSGKGGTHTKTCLLVGEKTAGNSRSKIFMAEAQWCGHDSRGNPIPKNDLPSIADKHKDFKKGRRNLSRDRFGFLIDRASISPYILAPRYYDPEPRFALAKLRATHELISIGDMIESGQLEIRTGDEVGKLAYGTGSIPFVRSSDLSNWEIKLDAKHGLAEEIYYKYKDKQDVREGDILMVRDGTYLIGTCAYISKFDCEIVYQSHLYKIRLLPGAPISPYLFLASISSKVVREQIKSLRFTQDIIDTIGKRIHEIMLPVPRDNNRREEIQSMVIRSINDRIEARELARTATASIATA